MTCACLLGTASAAEIHRCNIHNWISVTQGDFGVKLIWENLIWLGLGCDFCEDENLYTQYIYGVSHSEFTATSISISTLLPS